MTTPEEERAEAARRTKRALEVWEAAGPVRRSTGEYYLAMRSLPLPPELDGEVVRFHPNCPRERGFAPALVVLMRAMEGDTPRAIQRIFINKSYTKDGTPMMLGPVAGAAMKLTSHRATCCGAASYYAPKLHVCEGFESGLAALALGYAPVWALGSAGAIERLPLLWFVGQVVVIADNDDGKSEAGARAAANVLATWGWRASAITVDQPGKDLADMFAGEAPL